MVGQSAVATVQAYAYDATSAELNNIQAQLGSGASITGLFVDPIPRRIPTDLPCREQDRISGSPSIPPGWKWRSRSVQFARLGCFNRSDRSQEPWGVWGGEIFERRIIAQNAHAASSQT
jgi:hypothetical protein